MEGLVDCGVLWVDVLGDHGAEREFYIFLSAERGRQRGVFSRSCSLLDSLSSPSLRDGHVQFMGGAPRDGRSCAREGNQWQYQVFL